MSELKRSLHPKEKISMHSCLKPFDKLSKLRGVRQKSRERQEKEEPLIVFFPKLKKLGDRDFPNIRKIPIPIIKGFSLNVIKYFVKISSFVE